MHVTLSSVTTNAEALFELCARTAQKERREEKPAAPCNCKHCRYEKKVFGGLAKRHSKEYSDYTSISRYTGCLKNGEESVSEYENTSNKRGSGQTGWNQPLFGVVIDHMS